MSRTYRRRVERHEYRSVLCDWVFESDYLRPFPRWFCRIFKQRQRTSNSRELRRWLSDPGYDPVVDVKHRHSARWAWW
jgi:hypothetical protein